MSTTDREGYEPQMAADDMRAPPPGGEQGPPPGPPAGEPPGRGPGPPPAAAGPPPGYAYDARRAPPSPGWQSRSFGFDPRHKNVPLACFLSLMPGLGQIYVGYYLRGFVHILVVGSVIAILSEEPVRELVPLFGIFLPFFWLYNIVDAGRRAALYNQALNGGEGGLPERELPSGGTVFGGLTLVVVGLLLLMNTRFEMSMEWVAEWWPLAPIVFGLFLVTRGLRRQ